MPAGFLSPVSAANVIYEAFLVMGVLRWGCFSLLCIALHSLSSMKSMKRNIPLFPHINKGFIYNSFCTNWDVRNPAGWDQAKLSSLVNKQVAPILPPYPPHLPYLLDLPLLSLDLTKRLYYCGRKVDDIEKEFESCLAIHI